MSDIREKDKPFILGLISGALTIVQVLLGVVVPDAREWLKFTFPETFILTTTAWAFYFAKKGETEKP